MAAKKIEQITVGYEYDQDPDTSYLEQEGFEDRVQALNNDEFFYIGIRAEAEVVVGGTVQQISSGGIWGIESDSGKEYLEDIAREQLADLAFTLEELGFSKQAVKKAVKDAEINVDP